MKDIKDRIEKALLGFQNDDGTKLLFNPETTVADLLSLYKDVENEARIDTSDSLFFNSETVAKDIYKRLGFSPKVTVYATVSLVEEIVEAVSQHLDPRLNSLEKEG